LKTTCIQCKGIQLLAKCLKTKPKTSTLYALPTSKLQLAAIHCI
jgi:hypothetical protein